MYSFEMMVGIRNILLVQIIVTTLLLVPGASAGFSRVAASIRDRLFGSDVRAAGRRPSPPEQTGDFCEIDMSKFDE